MTKHKKLFPCEIALIVALVINSINLCLLVKSSFGVSTLSSVPLVLSLIFSKFSLGTWTFLVQAITLGILIIIIKQGKIGYLGSFITAILFGVFVDIGNNLLSMLPTDLSYRIIYFIIGFIGLGFGAVLFMESRLPIIPFDIFVRDISKAKHIKVGYVKIVYDIICVLISVILSLIFLNKINGVGIGTIISMFLMGYVIQVFTKKITNRYEFKPYFKLTNKIIKITEIN